MLQKNKISPDEILLFLILLFGPFAHGLVETWAITAVHVSTIFLLAFAVLTRLYRGSLIVYRTPVDLPVFLFCIIVFLSFFVSVYPYAGRIALYRILTCLALFYFVVNTQRRAKKISRLSKVLVISGGIHAVMGLILTDGNLLGFKVLSKGQYNISLFFHNHSHFAGYLEMLVWLSIGMATVSRGAKRLLFFSMGILMAVAVVFSLSRGGIIGLIAGLCFYLAVLFCIRKEMPGGLRFLIVFVFLAFIVLVWLGLDPVMARMKTLEDPLAAGGGRVQAWKEMLTMIFHRPLLGWGLGSFPFAFPPYQPELLSGIFVNHAHNDYLELAAETGVTGILTALLAVFMLFISCLKKLVSSKNKYFQPVGIGSLAGCFSLLVHALTDFNFHIPANAILFVVLAGIAVLSAAETAGEMNESVRMYPSFSRTGKLVGLVLILLTTCLSCAAVLSPLLGSIYVQEAKAYQKNGENDSAVAILEKAVLFDPGNAELMKIMGDMLRAKKVSGGWRERTETLKHVLSWYEQAVKICPVKGSYYTDKASVLELLDKPTEAEHAYKQALRYSPVNPSAYYSLATLYLRLHRLNEALRYYQKFLQLAKRRYLNMVLDDIWWGAGRKYEVLKKAVPETAAFRRAFSAYLFAKGRTWPAIQELELAFSLEPTADNALAQLRGLCRNKDVLEALEQTEAYLIRFPESLHLREQKAVILDRLGRNQEAAFVYRSLLEGVYKGRFLKLANRNYAVKYSTRIAQLYAKDKRYEEAVAVLKRGTGRHPREARLYYSLGIYLRQLNRREHTLTALKKAVFLDTSNVHYRYQLGEEYRRAGLYQNAAEEWKKCLEVKPGFAHCKTAIDRIEKELGLDSDLISYEKGLAFEFSNKDDAVKYSIHIAQLYAKDERYADAEAVLRKRIEKYPEEGRLYYPLGLYLHHLNRGRQALAALKKAVFFEYDNAEYRYRLGEEYRSGGLYRRAEEEWNICLEIAPDSAQCREAIIGVKDKIGLNGENEE